MAKKKTSAGPPSAEAQEHALATLRQADEPLDAKALAKLLQEPHHISAADLAPAAAQQAKQVRVSRIPIAPYVPMDLAMARGWFKDEGLDVTVGAVAESVNLRPYSRHSRRRPSPQSRRWYRQSGGGPADQRYHRRLYDRGLPLGERRVFEP